MAEHMISLMKQIFGLGLPCAFNKITGLYCPGCGGTRAVRSLIHGNMRMSFQYHPLILYIIIVVVLELGSLLLARIFHKPGLHIRHYNLMVYIGVVVIIVNWIFKNYMLICKGVDLLPLM